MSIAAEWDAPEPVREHLAALQIPPDERIIISWTDYLALETQWETFIRYWDSFCYPSSDDVTVWPVRGQWTLCYRHFEVIEFGRGPRAA